MNENALTSTALVCVLLGFGLGFGLGLATAAVVQGIAVFFGTGHTVFGVTFGMATTTLVAWGYLYYNPGVLIRMMPDEEGW